MTAGDLVEITFGELDVDGCRSPHCGVGIYIEPDHTSPWNNGEPWNYSKVIVLWKGDIHSVSNNQIEVIY